MMKPVIRVGMFAAALLVSACASDNPYGAGPRPPQGPGPAGTEFGFWDRDAEGSVDSTFRQYIARAYNGGDEAKAQANLEKDGFKCVATSGTTDGKPTPTLSCERLYAVDDDVHSWKVEFWKTEREPRAHYSRTTKRDPLKNYNDKHNKRPGGA